MKKYVSSLLCCAFLCALPALCPAQPFTPKWLEADHPSPAANQKLLDIRNNGSSVFSADEDGDVAFTGTITGDGSGLSGVTAGSLAWSNITDRPSGLDDGDDNTTYSAGTGLNLTGTTFSVNPSLTLGTEDSVASYILMHGNSTTTGPYLRLYNAGNEDGDVDYFNLEADGLYLYLRGTSASNMTLSLGNLGAGAFNLAIDGTYSGNGSGLTNVTASSVAWSNISNRPSGLDDGDDNTTYSAGAGLDLSGTTFSVEAALALGVEDTTAGSLTIHGNDYLTGGKLILNNGGAEDGDYDGYSIEADGLYLRIGGSSGEDGWVHLTNPGFGDMHLEVEGDIAVVGSLTVGLDDTTDDVVKIGGITATWDESEKNLIFDGGSIVGNSFVKARVFDVTDPQDDDCIWFEGTEYLKYNGTDFALSKTLRIGAAGADYYLYLGGGYWGWDNTWSQIKTASNLYVGGNTALGGNLTLTSNKKVVHAQNGDTGPFMLSGLLGAPVSSSPPPFDTSALAYSPAGGGSSTAIFKLGPVPTTVHNGTVFIDAVRVVVEGIDATDYIDQARILTPDDYTGYTVISTYTTDFGGGAKVAQNIISSDLSRATYQGPLYLELTMVEDTQLYVYDVVIQYHLE